MELRESKPRSRCAFVGGVLEPLQAAPTIIEDDCFIGARSEVVEGVIVGEGCVVAMGVFITATSKIVYRDTGKVITGHIPPYSVVVPGSLPGKPLADGTPGPSLSCAVIVKTVDAQTRSKTAINELLRLDSPSHVAEYRYASEDMTIAGAHVAEGDVVLLSLAAANRDPNRFPDPGALDLTRDARPHLAFGHGIHHCLGARLARLEAVIAFRGLLARFTHLRLAVDPSELHWNHGDGLVLRGLSALPVHLT